MKRTALSALFCLCLFIPSISSAVIGEAPNRQNNPARGREADVLKEDRPGKSAHAAPPRKFKEDELIVKLRKSAGKQHGRDAHAKMGSTVRHKFRNFGDLSVVRIPKGKALAEVLAGYRADPDVLYAEPNHIYEVQTTPNDPSFASLWGLNNTGQTGGTADADINAPEAWSVLTGSPETVVAVIDTGVDYNHQDLRDNMWTNPGEIPGNGIDDDGNGYIDDVHGINAITGSGDPMDDHFHGTHVSGTIAAAGNNNLGVVGVNWSAKIIACKFLGSNGSGYESDAVECLDYLYDLKTRPINPVNIVLSSNSWGGNDFSQALLDAIDTHRRAGVLFVAAAGNSSADLDSSTHFYPAGYELPNIIRVAASDHTDNIASFSNYGRHSVHVAAPGVNILSTTIGDTYGTYSGTSMAAPHVSGLAALVKAQDPSRDWKTIKNLILAGGQPTSSAGAKTATGRRIRAYDVNGTGSLSCSNQTVAERLQPPRSDISAIKGEEIRLTYLHINCANPIGEVVVSASDGTQITLLDDGQNADQEAGDGVYSATWTPVAQGQYTLTFPGNDVVTVRIVKSYQAPVVTTYDYRTITGTKLLLIGNTPAAIFPPFPIFFADDPVGYTALYASNQGTISFASKYVPLTNEPLPTGVFETLVAPYWEDLVLNTGGVYYEIVGSYPHRELVIEWRNAASLDPDVLLLGGTVTFQVVFFERSPDVLFNYKDVTIGSVIGDAGALATIGIQTSYTTAQQYGFNSPVLSDGLALLWHVAAISASAGPDQFAVPGAAVTLDGSHSARGDSLTIAYSWTQTGGTPVALNGADTAKPTFVAPQSSETLTFQLTVTGDTGQTATDTIAIVTNLPPIAEAGPDQTVNYGAAVNLDGSGSHDQNGTIASYSWTQVSGTAVTLTGATTATASFTAPSSGGLLTFQLTVTDDSGQSASDTVNVRVATVPVAEAGPDQWVLPGASVALNGGGSYDPDGTIVTYSWTQTAGPAVVLTGNGTAAPSFTAPDTNVTLTFSLTVIDNEGLAATGSVSVTVNLAAVANAGSDQSAVPGATVTLNGSASYDPDGLISGYTWTQTAGVAVTLTNANTSTPRFTAPTATDTLIFQLTVTDNSGQSSSASVAVSVYGMFHVPVNYAAGSSARSVTMADFNGDGRPDLAVANYSGNNVSILLGNGDGTFQTAVNYAAGSAPRSVTTADFNGDGSPDLAVANYSGNNVSVLLGNGDGTFQTTVNYAAGSAPRSVTTADFNGDGSPDLAVANYSGNNVSVLLGNGNGTFQAAVAYGAGTQPSSIVPADFNNDGKIDLAAVNYGGASVSVLLGTGDGAFQGAMNYTVGLSPQSAATGDFNGDGKADLAVAYSPQISVPLGKGDGSFQGMLSYQAGTTPNFVTASDVNGDGKLDLVVTNSTGVSVLLGNASGFKSAVSYGVGTSPLSVAVGDINGDGKPDLAVVNSGSNNVSILLNTMVRIVPAAGPHGGIACAPLMIMPKGSSACTITPDAGYPIVDVSVNGSSVGPVASYTFSDVVSDQTISAIFEVPPAAGATLAGSPANTQVVGNAVTFTAGGTGGAGIYEYLFLVINNGAEIARRSYDASNTWTWDTTGAAVGAYTVRICVRNAGSSATCEAQSDIDYTLSAAAVSSVTLAADKPSPAALLSVGAVTFTATATGGGADKQYQFAVKDPATGVMTVKRAYAASNSFSYAPASVGVYKIRVYVRNADSLAAYEAAAWYTFTVTADAPVASVTLGAVQKSPQAVGTGIDFNANAAGTTDNYVYQFWVNTSGVKTMVQDYSSSAGFHWDTTSSAPGTYTIRVMAKNAGSVAAYEAANSLSYIVVAAPPVTAVTLGALPKSPQAVGTAIDFNASATGTSGNYVYQFWVSMGGVWAMEQDYSSSAGFHWDTTNNLPGTYTIQVRAKNAGSVASYEAVKSISYFIVAAPPVTAVTLSAVPKSPQAVGTGVDFNASAAGTSGNYVYQFWVNTSGVWAIEQDYSSSAVFHWDTTNKLPGTYTIQVRAKNAGSIAAYEAAKPVSYVIY